MWHYKRGRRHRGRGRLRRGGDGGAAAAAVEEDIEINTVLVEEQPQACKVRQISTSKWEDAGAGCLDQTDFRRFLHREHRHASSDSLLTCVLRWFVRQPMEHMRSETFLQTARMEHRIYSMRFETLLPTATQDFFRRPTLPCAILALQNKCNTDTYTDTDRHTRTHKQQTATDTNRQTDRQTGRQTDRHT
jgi:hypothetical protein